MTRRFNTTDQSPGTAAAAGAIRAGVSIANRRSNRRVSPGAARWLALAAVLGLVLGPVVAPSGVRASGGGDGHGGGAPAGGGKDAHGGGKPKPKPKPKPNPDCLWSVEMVVKLDETTLTIPKEVVRRRPPPMPALVDRHVVFVDKVALRLKITTPEGVVWVFPLTRMALPEIQCEGFIVGEPLLPVDRAGTPMTPPPWATRR